MNSTPRRRRIVHVVCSFGVGGLENVNVQLINHLPVDQFEHVVMSLATIGDLKRRILRPGVRFFELHKAAGHAVPRYPRVCRPLREIRPDVVHTCKLAALEITPLAWRVRVPLRIRAERGWDAHDPRGQNTRCHRRGKRYKPSVILRMLGCFVLSSKTDGTSCILQEAMASGLPVVAKLVGGTPEVVEDGVTGLFGPSDNADAMAAALWNLHTDSERTNFLGQAARRMALKQLGIEAMVRSDQRLFSSQHQGESVYNATADSAES